MRRNELTGRLREPYRDDVGYGVVHADRPGYERIWFVVLPPPPTAVPGGLPTASIARATRVLQSRPAASAASELDRLSAYLFARREALASSRMEGTWSTIDDVLTPIDDIEDPDHRSDRQSVRGYAAALEFGFARVAAEGMAAMTPALVQRLHEMVMSRDPRFRGIAGQFRHPGSPGDSVQIGGMGRKEDSIFNPPPPDFVNGCLDTVLAWMRDETVIEMGDAGMGMALPVRMAIGHAHFEAVHPFSDGNGRVGRLLWSLQIAQAGGLPLHLSSFVEAHRDRYSKALQSAQKRLDYGPIVSLVCDAVIASADEEQAGKAAIADLPEQWRGRTSFRSGSSAERALPVLLRLPVLTAQILADQLDVSFQAASQALKRLEDCGIVRERTGRGRNRLFAAEEVIAILARPCGEDPEFALQGARHRLGVGTKKVDGNVMRKRR